jgi:pimeloyl-ACP methyl ester carboxylesterase
MRFVLVHGGFHGAWCWDLLIPELEKLGHQAVAMDLPGHGKRVSEDATLAGYRDAVVEVIEPGDVLVGHSMGGFVTTVAVDAAIDRVSHVVYLAAGLPIEGQPMAAAGAGDLGGRSEIIEVVDNGKRMQFRTDEAATAFFYHDCPPGLAKWACNMLTPQPLAPMMEPISIPRFWSAELPRSLILCRQDSASRAGDAGNQLMAERLGAEPLWLDGSHSPFLSQPTVCAETIIEAVCRPANGRLRPT